MTAREIALKVVSSTVVRDLDYLVTKAQELGADPAEARAALRELLGLPKDRPR
jgi:hypothetical protein